MKIQNNLKIGIFVCFSWVTDARSIAAGLTIPTSDDGIADSISSSIPIPYTAAELAVPPFGEIQKSYLREISRLSNSLNSILSAIRPGPDGQGSPWYMKAQAFKSGLNVLAVTRLQSDCMALIPQMVNLFESKKSEAPAFAIECSGLAADCGPVVIHAITRYVINQNAGVSPSVLNEFIKVFSVPGFIVEGDWEDSPIPVNSAGIMILDAAAVVEHLKTRPWQEADQFLGNATAAEAFSRYSAAGNGMAILKTKYSANESTIKAKWNELAAWVATQRPPN